MQNPVTALPAQMITAYFTQSEQYFSSSKGEFLKVGEMHPNHAANAAASLLRDARTWVADAAAGPCLPTTWMTRQPLFLALISRANAAQEGAARLNFLDRLAGAQVPLQPEPATTCRACGKPCIDAV